MVAANELDLVHFGVMLLDLFASVYPYRRNAQPFEYCRIHFAVMAVQIQLFILQQEKKRNIVFAFDCDSFGLE